MLVLSFISFVFWKFEERTRMLIKNAEEALKFLDQEVVDPDFSPLALFHRDDMNVSRDSNFFLCRNFSYSRLFRWVYLYVGSGSVVGFGLMTFLITMKS